ncbi:MAG: RNA polymerase sigma factor [Phycisphaeraceae bacterium]|nr:RNA polymerase sigma factor [Phycisphaeraceae bacterium]
MPRSAQQVLDELLVLQAQDGDRRALHLLLERWAPRLLARARDLCNSPDAADVAQLAMIAIARGLAALDDPAAFPAWAMRIVAHKSSDWIRARTRERARHQPLPTRAPGAPAAPHQAAPRHDPAQPDTTLADAESRAITSARVRRALDRLRPDRRAILALHYAHDLPIDAIARALAIPPGTAKSRLFHARKDLKRILERDTQ